MRLKSFLAVIIVSFTFNFAWAKGYQQNSNQVQQRKVKAKSKVKKYKLKNYYKYLDFQNPKLKNEIPAFENALLNRINNKKKTDSDKKLAKMIVYTALFMTNVTNALYYGDLSYGQVTRYNRFSDNNDKESEIKARFAYEIKIFKQAMELDKTDPRYPAWFTAVKIRRDKYTGRKVNRADLEKLVEHGENHVFNFFNALAITIDHEFPKDLEDRLFARAEEMTGKDSPCRLVNRHPQRKQCTRLSFKAPFSLHGSFLFLADQYIKKAIHSSNDKKTTNRERDRKTKKYARKAKKIIQVLKGVFSLKSLRWKFVKSLDTRYNVAKELQRTGHLQGSRKTYYESAPAKDIYGCFSCHQGGKARKVFK